MTDRNDALRLADELAEEAERRVCHVAMAPASLLKDAAAELRNLLAANLRMKDLVDMALADVRSLTAERDQLRAEVERYHHLRNSQSWPAVFASHDAPEPLRGDELDAALDHARTTHKDPA